MAEVSGSTGAAPSSSGPGTRSWAGLAVGAALLAGGGYLVGAHSAPASVAVHHGTAVISPVQIAATAGGVTYDIPLDVQWKDSSGGWHEGDRPSCLPATSSSAPVTFGAVKYELGGVGGYAVVWVDCSR
ncbi:MAG: hypothetical protein ACXVFU_16400 [Nocardioidaceae bacterium]